MIRVKSDEEIALMREAGRLTANTLAMLKDFALPGVTTERLDTLAHEFICDNGGKAPCVGYMGYPKAICTSVNEQIVHGIPGKYVLKDGDIVSCDIVAQLNGWNGDATRTFLIGDVKDEVKKLVKVTEECFYEGIKFARVGCRISDISKAIQAHAQKHGYGVIREYIGHGIGKKMHEDPEVPNFYDPKRGRGPMLCKGMTLAIEPMIALGKPDHVLMPDGWTAYTADKSPCAHYENTIAITDDAPLILTQSEDMNE